MLHSTATGKATLAVPDFSLHWAAKEYHFIPLRSAPMGIVFTLAIISYSRG
jgi:hypothetical protein